MVKFQHGMIMNGLLLKEYVILLNILNTINVYDVFEEKPLHFYDGPPFDEINIHLIFLFLNIELSLFSFTTFIFLLYLLIVKYLLIS